MGFYYTPSWMALLGMRGLVHGPRPEQNQPKPTEPRQRYRQDLGGYSIDDSALALGSRSTGLGGMVEEPRARFHVPEWGVFCHTAKLRNHPPCLKLVLSDSTRKGSQT